MEEIIGQVSATIDALMEEFNTITHNLANVNTVGYKRRCNAFSRMLEGGEVGTDTYLPGEIDLESVFDFSQGSVSHTGRPLDFALYGKGFFVIETPDGPLYTRNGVFQINQNGQIVNSDGNIVAGEAGPITVPANLAISQVSVSSDGTISAGETTIGKFTIVDFGENENKLVPAGSSCFQMLQEDIQPVAAENIAVKQGYQEVSNVKIVNELVDMILVTRLYEANMQAVSAEQQVSSSIISVAMG